MRACNRVQSGSFFIQRCGEYVGVTATTGLNEAPTVSEPIGDMYFNPNGNPVTVDLSGVFHDPDNDTLTYEAESSDITVATSTVSGSTLTLTPIDLGTATITVTAKDRQDTDAAQLTASDTFTATVDYLPAITVTAQHAERTEGQEIRLTLTADPAPSQHTEVKICVSQGEADYLTHGTPSPECDITGPIDHTNNRVLAKIGFAAGSASEELILQTEDDETSEENAAVTAAILRNPGDPYTAGNPQAATTTVTDNDTLALSVEPRPLRQVRISWNAIPGAAGYHLENQQEGQAWASPTVVPYSANETQADLDLNRIDGSQGLGHANYELRIRGFRFVSGNPQFTPYSQTIRLVDNPLLTTGGRAYSPNRPGVAELKWAHLPNVKAGKFTVVYRKLGGDHTAVDWPDQTATGEWPFYGPTLGPKEVTQTSTGSSTEVDSLEAGRIYAFQVTYETVAPAGIKVFSARDAYVWPESISPAHQTPLFRDFLARVATFPYFGHHPSKQFKYIICDSASGFGMGTDQAAWEQLVNAALQAWQNAVHSMITVSQDTATACASGPLANFIEADDDRSEVRVFNLTNNHAVVAFNEFTSDPFKICLNQAPACVTSFTGYAGTYLTNEQREQIGTLIAKQATGTLTNSELTTLGGLILGTETRHTVSAGTRLRGVDINFKKSGIEDFIKDSKTITNDPNTTGFEVPNATFGRCETNHNTLNRGDQIDREFGLFTLALHEGGHALGISGLSYEELTDLRRTGSEPAQSYETSHPTIPDSVLNYDKELRNYYRPAGNSDFRENDCEPHPFDLLAIFALYQNLP